MAESPKTSYSAGHTALALNVARAITALMDAQHATVSLSDAKFVSRALIALSEENGAAPSDRVGEARALRVRAIDKVTALAVAVPDIVEGGAFVQAVLAMEKLLELEPVETLY